MEVSPLDYVVFGSMLLISTGIGIYHGLFGRISKDSSPAQHFLTASGQISTFPVALSLLASFLSSVTLMGHPAEVYLYGSQMWLFGVSMFLMVPFVGYYMVPFFRKNNYVSAYQYFSDRFSRRIQFVASLLFSCQVVFFLALVVYAPALAVHQATGFSVTSVVTVLYVICTFYTTVGGMKAVVWTDTFQIIVIFASLIAVVIKGTYEVGGLSVVWERNAKFNRTTFFNWDIDPTERFTVWSTGLGSVVGHIAVYGGNQLQVQRYFTVATVKDAQNMLWINAFGWTFILGISLYTGLLIFATYLGCDPLMSKRILKADQLFPLYVIETLSDYPGFRGLFMCSIFSAALSTMSTGMNSLSAVWYSELRESTFVAKISDKGAGVLVKILSLMFGVISYLCVFLVPYMGGLIAMNMTFLSICIGSLFGLFILGICFKKANTLGAWVGLFGSVAFMLWTTVGGVLASQAGFQVDQPPLPSSTALCHANSTLSVDDLTHQLWVDPTKPKAMPLYRVSYLWYNTMAMLSCIIIGVTVSYISQLFKEEPRPDINIISLKEDLLGKKPKTFTQNA